MVRIIKGAEEHGKTQDNSYRINQKFGAIDESIALAVMYTANHLPGIKAIICLTETGSTPRLMSRISSDLPIFAFSRRIGTQRSVALYRGVQTVAFDTDTISAEDANKRAVEQLKAEGVVTDGDLIILTKGDTMNIHGGTNSMKIIRVGEVVQ